MNNFIKIITIVLFTQLCNKTMAQPLAPIKISPNHHYFITEDKTPFFWLGDTGWLLFIKLNREEVIKYLDDRKEKGFNVIQVMVLHDTKHAVNVYGDSALINGNPSMPKTTTGNDFKNKEQYDFWNNVDFVIDEAAKRGIYMGLVPIWGSNVKSGFVNEKQAADFGTFLAKRYKNKSNIVWLNGGDIMGSDKIEIWNALGNALRKNDPNHLITFHPRGRAQSSTWFHNASWLDFNMFQSGHKDYEQDTVTPRMGEDNYKYVNTDYVLKPTKPTIDGEPVYEKIPHGLHDTLATLWNDNDVRRYAYWSVFAGGAGFTYGHSAVMQFFNGVGAAAYGAKQKWTDALNDPGAKQMHFLKDLMLSKPYLDRIPDQTLIADNTGEKYDYLIATRGRDYAFIYTATGKKISVNMGKLKEDNLYASWYNPRNGDYTKIGTFVNKGQHEFTPPGEDKYGNDWVLVLESVNW